MSDWTPDVLLALVLAVAVAYVLGVRRLAARGRSWPARRSVCFGAGIAVLVVATQSGIAAYDTVLFSVHVVQHLLIGMVAPLLLALGAPVTLALQASQRGTQQRLLRVLHSPPVRVIAHPLVAWLLFATTLVALYFTPLYELSLRNDFVHIGVHAHFLVVGSLFCWTLVALDPMPNPLGHGARVLYVAILIPFHAFLGVALLSATTVIAADWYESVGRTWGASLLDDQRTGAGILWVTGELFGVIALIIAVARWMAHDEREAVRADRRLDEELAAAAAAGVSGAPEPAR